MTLKSIAQNPEIREGMTRAEIDAAIARHADTEILFDRPYIDAKVVRVAGPFTVESLSPHRVVADGPEDLVDPPAPIEESGRFVETILDNLRASGVDNRVKGERLRFETLDPFPGPLPPGRRARTARARPTGGPPSRSGRSTGPSARTSSARPPWRPAATSTSSSSAASPSTPSPTRRRARRCASAG